MPSGGLQVFDATSPQLPWVGGVWNFDSVGNFAVYRDHAYVLNSYGRLYVYRLNSMPHLDMRNSSENWTLRWEDRFTDYELFQAPTPEGPWEKDRSPVFTGDGYVTRPVQPSEPLYFQLLRAED
jgi:hypothetical protein